MVSTKKRVRWKGERDERREEEERVEGGVEWAAAEETSPVCKTPRHLPTFFPFPHAIILSKVSLLSVLITRFILSIL